MRSDFPTVSELTSYLKKSSLPTLVVEGQEDVVYLKSIEHIVDGINIMPAGGKNEVLSLYENREDFRSLVLYFVDSDNWVFCGTPDIYASDEKFHVTSGYSLENDFIRDSKILSVLTPEEIDEFNHSLRILTDLMASCVARERHERFDYGKKLSCVFKFHEKELSAEATEFLSKNPPRKHQIDFVSSDPVRFFRGKTLSQILSFMLSRRSDRRALDMRSFFETVWVQAETSMGKVVDSIKTQVGSV